MQNEQSLLVRQSLDLESRLVTLRSTPFKHNVDTIATLERATELVDGMCHDLWVQEYAFRDEIEVLEEELETKEKEKSKKRKKKKKGEKKEEVRGNNNKNDVKSGHGNDWKEDLLADRLEKMKGVVGKRVEEFDAGISKLGLRG